MTMLKELNEKYDKKWVLMVEDFYFYFIAQYLKGRFLFYYKYNI